MLGVRVRQGACFLAAVPVLEVLASVGFVGPWRRNCFASFGSSSQVPRSASCWGVRDSVSSDSTCCSWFRRSGPVSVGTHTESSEIDG